MAYAEPNKQSCAVENIEKPSGQLSRLLSCRCFYAPSFWVPFYSPSLAPSFRVPFYSPSLAPSFRVPFYSPSLAPSFLLSILSFSEFS